jgi:exodeoxyribonuclease VII small subunit
MKEMSFEDAMKKIESIVDELEKGDLPLEDSLKRFEEAVKLARVCQKKLQTAEKKVSKLINTGGDRFELEPLEEPEQE